MAYRRKPNYHFRTTSDTGIDKVPNGRQIIVEDVNGETKSYFKTSDVGISPTTTIAEFIGSENAVSTSVDAYTKSEADAKIVELSPPTKLPVGKSSMLSGTASVSNTTLMSGMSTTLYSGNESTQSINAGVDLATQWGDNANETYGGLVWVKSRAGISANNELVDTVRGATNRVRSDSTSAQSTLAEGLTSFNANGFSVGIDQNYNGNTYTYASWIFQTTHRTSATDGSTELVDWGSFDNDDTANWTASANASVDASTGKLVITRTALNNNVYAYRTLAGLTIGKTYTIKFDAVKSGEFWAIGLDSDSSSISSTIGGNGLLSFTATATTHDIYIYQHSVNTVGINIQIDNISVKENTKPTNHNKYWESHYNPITGFTMVKYEGSGIAGHEIPHHLGRELGFAISKRLNNTSNWQVTSPIFDGGMLLNGTNSSAVYGDMTSFDNENFIIDVIESNGSNNTSGDQYILYGWANSYYDDLGVLNGNYEVGIYQGTGASGNKITTRGKPAWVMVKRLDSTGHWHIYDNLRAFDGTKLLYANLAQAETSDGTRGMQQLADGFLVTGNNAEINASGGQYLYMVVYDNDSGSGKSKFDMVSETSNLQLTNLVASFTNGVDSNGVVNTIKNLGSFTVAPTNGWEI